MERKMVFGPYPNNNKISYLPSETPWNRDLHAPSHFLGQTEGTGRTDLAYGVWQWHDLPYLMHKPALPELLQGNP